MKVIILHCKSLTNRKLYLIENFKNLNLDIHWIENYDANELTEKLIDQHYNYDPLVFNRKLVLPEISLWIKHCTAYDYIIKNNLSQALILEDDVHFNKDILIEQIEFAQKNIPNNYDIACLGCGWIPEEYRDEKYFLKINNVYNQNKAGMRCTDSYIINKFACKTLLENKIVNWPADHHISLFKNIHKICWINNPIFIQASLPIDAGGLGLYPSSVHLFK